MFCVFAAILGMYTLMSNKQYYDALGGVGTIVNTEGINSKYTYTRALPRVQQQVHIHKSTSKSATVSTHTQEHFQGCNWFEYQINVKYIQ